MTEHVTIIGIDPGYYGAIAFLTPPETAFDGDWQARVFCMPTITTFGRPRPGRRKGRRITEFDRPAIFELFQGYNATNCIVEIEAAQVMIRPDKGKRKGVASGFMPQESDGGGAQGSVSNFKIGYGAGFWDGFFTSRGIAVHVVRPVQWQRVMLGKNLPDTKAASIRAARRMFPVVDLRRTEKCRNDHDGKADALNIAAYGARRLGKA